MSRRPRNWPERRQAFLAGEYGKIADLTCPQIIESMGGKDKMAEIVEKE